MEHVNTTNTRQQHQQQQQLHQHQLEQQQQHNENQQQFCLRWHNHQVRIERNIHDIAKLIYEYYHVI